jgi:hypothetical protein
MQRTQQWTCDVKNHFGPLLMLVRTALRLLMESTEFA